MKSRTSFFNGTVLRKNLIRFAPLWVLTTILEILILLPSDTGRPVYMAADLLMAMGAMAILVMIYAICVTGCVFGDLFNSRMCNGLHTMPIRREGWLLTNLASGFLFALIPMVAGGVFTAVMLQEYYWIALVWQSIILLQFVFFFGAAVFSAICAGKKLGMMAIYVLINFLSVLIYWIAQLFYEPLFHGVVLSYDAFTRFSPIVAMSGAEYVKYDYTTVPALSWNIFNARDWSYLFICAGMGILLLVFSWLFYRKRHLETAGDFISFRSLKIVFLLAYTLAVGAFVHTFFGALAAREGNYGFLIVGVLIGWFTGWMLLERTVKIFNKKVILGLAAFGLIFAGSVGLTALDPMGIADYIPKTEIVESACLYTQLDYHYYNYDWQQGGWYRTDPEEIAQVQQLHRQMIKTPEEKDAETIPTYVCYRLKNGKEVKRTYEIPVNSPTAEELGSDQSSIQAVLHTDEDWETIKENVRCVTVFWNSNRPNTMILPTRKEMLDDVLEAFEADCQAGTMAQHDGFHKYGHSMASIEISWEDQQYGNRVVYLTVYPDSEQLYVVLREI